MRWYAEEAACPKHSTVLYSMDILHRPFCSWVLSSIPHAKTFLDIASGSGVLSSMLLKRDNTVSVTLLDKSRVSLRFSEKKLYKYRDRCAFVEGDAEALPFDDESFFSAAIVDSIYYLDPLKALSEAYRVLKKGGTLIVAFQAYDNTSVSKWASGIVDVKSPERIMKIMDELGFDILSFDKGAKAWARIVAIKGMC